MPIVTWNIGPDEVDIEAEVNVYPGEPMVMYTRNGDGYPGSDPWGEVVAVVAVEGGTKRELTVEEEKWFVAEEDRIIEDAFSCEPDY